VRAHTARLGAGWVPRTPRPLWSEGQLGHALA